MHGIEGASSCKERKETPLKEGKPHGGGVAGGTGVMGDALATPSLFKWRITFFK